MVYKYRNIEINDYEKMIAIWKNSAGIGLSNADSKENIAAFLERNKGLSFLCEKQDDIIGTILCGNDGRRAYIYHLFVQEGYRKQGVGVT